LRDVRFVVMPRRSMPDLDARAVAAGVLLSVLVAVLGFFLGFPPIFELLGAAAGGYAAGRMAGRDGLFHGAAVGAIDVVALAILTTASAANVPDVVVDTVATIVSDVLLLALAAVGGRLAARS
jgi:hypothetical protein